VKKWFMIIGAAGGVIFMVTFLAEMLGLGLGRGGGGATTIEE
jgi:hypothetical protein